MDLNIELPLVSSQIATEQGYITRPWLELFQRLWKRTGGIIGLSTEDAMLLGWTANQLQEFQQETFLLFQGDCKETSEIKAEDAGTASLTNISNYNYEFAGTTVVQNAIFALESIIAEKVQTALDMLLAGNILENKIQQILELPQIAAQGIGGTDWQSWGVLAGSATTEVQFPLIPPNTFLGNASNELQVPSAITLQQLTVPTGVALLRVTGFPEAFIGWFPTSAPDPFPSARSSAFALKINGAIFNNCYPTLQFLPIDNPLLTYTNFLISTEALQFSTREYAAMVEMQVDKGGAGSGNSKDKVALACTIQTLNNGHTVGDIWALYPTCTLQAGAAPNAVHGIELDLNNYSGTNYGNATGGAGLASPTCYGISVTGAGTYKATAAHLISGPGSPIWNRGIVFANGCIEQACIEDYTTPTYFMSLYGNYATYALNLVNCTIVAAGKHAVMVPTGYKFSTLTSSAIEVGLVYMGASGTFTDYLQLGELNNLLGVITWAPVEPAQDGVWDLGSAARRWQDVWATNGTIQTSDLNAKFDVALVPACLQLVNKIQPKTWKWLETGNAGNGTRKGVRTHWGFLAQDIHQVIIEESGLDFAGYVKDACGLEGLRDSELLPILWKAVQELAKQVEDLRHGT